jgi:hypothetical protein
MRKAGGEQYGRRTWKWLISTMRNTTKGNMASPWKWMPLGTWWVWCALLVYRASSSQFFTNNDLLPFQLFILFPWRPVKNSGRWWMASKGRSTRRGKCFRNLCWGASPSLWIGERKATWHLWRIRYGSVNIQTFHFPRESQEGLA